jgi:malic enzyme
LSEDYIIPGVFNAAVAEAVAREVKKAAIRTGVGREKSGYKTQIQKV